MGNNEHRFATLYEQNRRDLFIYLMRSVRDESNALDLVHDSFLNFIRIFDHRELPDDRECRMYLFRVARNLLINQTKSAYQRRVTLVEGYGDSTSGGSQERQTPEQIILEKLANEESEELLTRLFSILEEQERSALQFRYYHSMQLDEIAAILSVSISTASRLIHAAERKMLHEAHRLGIDLP